MAVVRAGMRSRSLRALQSGFSMADDAPTQGAAFPTSAADRLKGQCSLPDLKYQTSTCGSQQVLRVERAFGFEERSEVTKAAQLSKQQRPLLCIVEARPSAPDVTLEGRYILQSRPLMVDKTNTSPDNIVGSLLLVLVHEPELQDRAR